METQDSSNFLTVEDVAKMFMMDKQTVRRNIPRWREDYGLTAIKIGNKFLIPEEDILNMLELMKT